ncbi:MAG: hypothetical protein Q4P23_12975 [Micrococcaceae bacterium]|nr:hypothetical protein [Micrococcaceae bacterium]
MNPPTASPAGVDPAPARAEASRRNPYLIALWILTAALFLMAFIVKVNGSQLWNDPEGMGTLFGAPVVVFYNLAAFVVALLAVMSLMCTLVCHAFSPRSTAG